MAFDIKSFNQWAQAYVANLNAHQAQVMAAEQAKARADVLQTQVAAHVNTVAKDLLTGLAGMGLDVKITSTEIAASLSTDGTVPQAVTSNDASPKK